MNKKDVREIFLVFAEKNNMFNSPEFNRYATPDYLQSLPHRYFVNEKGDLVFETTFLKESFTHSVITHQFFDKLYELLARKSKLDLAYYLENKTFKEILEDVMYDDEDSFNYLKASSFLIFIKNTTKIKFDSDFL